MKTHVTIFRDPNDLLYTTLAMLFKVFCTTDLGLKEGEFNIFWFPSSNTRISRNHSIHLDCNNPDLIERIRSELPKQNFIDFIHKGGLKKIDLRIFGDLYYTCKYQIHIKILS